jgi:hypothetical protein
MKLYFISVEMWNLRAMGTEEIPLNHRVSLYYVEVHVSIIIIIIIIIIVINCNWVVNQWQWLFYMYTNMR